MHMPVYIVYAALVAVVRSSDENNYYGREMEPIVSSSTSTDPDNIESYLLQRLMAKYRPNAQQQQQPQQYLPFYPLSDIATNNIDDNLLYASPDGRTKRANMGGYMTNKQARRSEYVNGQNPSLSISNSLDVLRNRLLLEISRKNSMKSEIRNRAKLCQIGKRSAHFDFKQLCKQEEYVNPTYN